MRTIYDPSLKATVTLDDSGQTRGINHLDEYREIEHLRGREAATAYLRDIAGKLSIAPEAMRSIERAVSYLDPQQQDVEYRFSEEKASFDSATYAYHQTYLNTPVWAAGITTTIKQAPTRVVAATNTSERGIDATMPSNEAIERYRRLFATGEKIDGPPSRRKAKRNGTSDVAGSGLLADILSKSAKASKGSDDRQTTPRLIRGRFFVYQYDPAERSVDHLHPTQGKRALEERAMPNVEQPLCGTPPTLPLRPVPRSIREGRWYLVAELLFRLPYKGGRMNWRMLVEVETNTILYLRALSSGVNGLVFTYDPITSTGTTTNTPDKSNAVLNPHRDDVVLANLNAPVAGVQSLEGAWATLTEESLPRIAPPSNFTGVRFDYDVRTDDFAAVNAYYHVDRFFQLVENLGFPIAGAGGYFDGTAFPVEVDHRGMGTGINAQCVGDGDGIDFTQYALADITDVDNPVGIATDWRVILHEMAGHGTLEDHVGIPNFGFAHSAGDSFAMILNDYLSEWHHGAALDRFLLAPFVPGLSSPRRSDRAVADGWGWGGIKDKGIGPGNSGYESEQILSTTMFRVYRAIGGDSSSAGRREFAARYMAYLMLRAIGTLTPLSNPRRPEQFLAALTNADAGNWTSEGVFGGAYGKTLVWSFEKQNLNSGARPAVDVYIDDGRAGEYDYLPVHWGTTTIWNRRNPDGKSGHQEPALGETNYAYVKIKNRGTTVANNVIVKGYHCKPSAGVLWPNDLQPFTTAQLSPPPTDNCVAKRKKVAESKELVADLKGLREGATGTLLHGILRQLAQAQRQLARDEEALAKCEKILLLPPTLQPNNTEEKTVGPFKWTPVLNAWGHDCMVMIVSATGDPSNVDKFTAGEVIEDWRLVPNDNNVAQRNSALVPGGGGTKGLVAGLNGKGFWVGNPGRTAATIAVSITLPPLLVERGWRIELRDLPPKGARLKAREQRLVTFEVFAGAAFTRDEVMAAGERDIVVTATADGAIIGGMVYQMDPELEIPFNDRTPEDKKEGCRDTARQLLDCLDMPSGKVKRVHVRKIAIDVEMQSDDGCCD
ncbi:MAG: hypothetical protein ACJ74J_17965 [Blastocatellia bacterium]